MAMDFMSSMTKQVSVTVIVVIINAFSPISAYWKYTTTFSSYTTIL